MPFSPLLALLALAAAPQLVGPEKEVVREQRSVTIGGIREVWRLIWHGTPKDDGFCGVTDRVGAMSAPCYDFSYAEHGDLVLERQRPGKPPESMYLTPLFTDCFEDVAKPEAILARWPMRSLDTERYPTPARIRARSSVPLMRLRDYNHDGIAGEFILRVRSRGCGNGGLVAIGVTRDNPRLHALTTAEHPERPLMLERWQWQALARSTRPGKVPDVGCGEHGSEEESVVALRTERGRLHATRITSTCPDRVDAKGEWYHDDHFVRKVLKRDVL